VVSSFVFGNLIGGCLCLCYYRCFLIALIVVPVL
jgi:hypothetical protein